MAEAELLVDRLGALAVVRLNRPKAINALSLTMLEGLDRWLERLAADDGVGAVLLRGEGERGFCAGGDVRHVRDVVLAGRPDEARRYFETEYRVDLAIGTCPKPVIAIQHGVVMGGGIGLSAHASHRVGVAGAQFAMPEPAIGFFADVGVRFALRKVPRHRALAFLMSGRTVGVADAIALGLCDGAIGADAIEPLQSALAEAAGADAPATAIAETLSNAFVAPGQTTFVEGCDALQAHFEAADPAGMLAALEKADARKPDGFAASLATRMRAGCPTSLAANWAGYLASDELDSLAECLANDLGLALHMVARRDFAEGVRAVLIDKDRNARWEPDRIEAVDLDPLDRLARPASGRTGPLLRH